MLSLKIFKLFDGESNDFLNLFKFKLIYVLVWKENEDARE